MKRNLRVLTVFGLAGIASIMGACSQTSAPTTSIQGVSSILFVKRATTVVNPDNTVSVDVAGGNGQVLDYQRYVPGGSLNILSPASSAGTVTDLTGDFPQADFNGADVSFDGTQAVFSMKRDGNDHYHIYTVQLAPGADGKFEMHQKTAGDADDVSPIYIPGNLIAFVTNEMYTPMGTRADEYEHSREALQLATISVDGGDAQRHLFAQNLSHVVTPFLRYDGRIGFSQWEHFADTNDVKLRVVNPDGTQTLAIAGQHGKPSNALFTVKELSPNVMIGIGTTRSRTIHAGSLLKIDARNANDPACMDDAQYASGGTIGHACLNEEAAQVTVLTPDVPTGSDPSPAGRYREPSLLPDGRILTSWADGPVNDMNEQSLTPPDFGIYVYDLATGQNQLVYNDRAFWDLNAIAIAPRTEPPAIASLQHMADSTLATHIGSVNITETSLQESVNGAEFNNTALADALKQATAVRVIEGFSSEAAKGVTMFGLTMFEGASVLGEAPVFPDGSWLADAPSYVPLHVQPIDKFGLSIRNQRLWIQGMPGEDRRCVGCHESRTGQGVPALGQNPTRAEQNGPQAYNETVAVRTAYNTAGTGEYPWNLRVQPILTAKCAGCHNSGTSAYYTLTRTDPTTGAMTTYKVPSLDLSDTPVTVYYDRQVHSWPASYVSIFYPAVAMMGDGTIVKTKITGPGPCPNTGLPPLAKQGVDGVGSMGCTPQWGLAGDARESALTAKINLRAQDGTTAWSLATNALHGEDKGTTLTDDERKTIGVYPMDLGAQYYARSNTGFAPFLGSDPVTQH
jgi:hypothetical protein